MIESLATRGGLTATTALVACGALLVTPAGQDLWRRPAPGVPALEEADVGPRAAAPQAAAEPAPTAARTREDAAAALAPDPEDPVLPHAEAGLEAPASEPAAEGPEPAGIVIVPDGASDRAMATGRALGGVEAPAAMAAPLASTEMAAPAEADAAEDLVEDAATLGVPDGSDGAAAAADPVPRAPAAAAPALPAPALPAPAAQGLAAQGLATAGATAPPLPAPDTEGFADAPENPLRVTAEDPVSTFSIDVDTASYAAVRRSLMAGALPPPEAVRVEEMVNYFPYAWPAPAPGEGPFRPTVTVQPTPWNEGTRLVAVAIQGEPPAVEDRPPLNLVFLIDTSGSMDEPAKLPLLRRSFRLLVDGLRARDEVAIVAYAGGGGLVLPPTPASDRGAILGALDALAPGGGTDGQGGIERAYAVAEGMAAPGEASRVILATDGDFDLGLAEPGALEGFVALRRQGGVDLSVLGFGRGDLDDATMRALARAGNGAAAYVDTLAEARKALSDQLAGAPFPLARDVEVQVEWNPAAVAEWRLIGYETRAPAREDVSGDGVDAGELDAGHSVTALYEVTPVGGPARLTEDLRHAAEAAAPEGPQGDLGLLRLRWQEPGGARGALLETPIRQDAGGGGREAAFAAAIAGWGQLLRGSDRLGDWSYDDAVALASRSRGEDPFGHRAEAVRLMRLSASLAD